MVANTQVDMSYRLSRSHLLAQKKLPHLPCGPRLDPTSLQLPNENGRGGTRLDLDRGKLNGFSPYFFLRDACHCQGVDSISIGFL